MAAIMNYFLIAISQLILMISPSCCANVPVLMWSSKRLTDVVSPIAGHTIHKDSFTNDYLNKLSCKDCQNHVVIAFLQKQLSMNDITHHGNVYSLNSNGGALPNIKGFMEKMPSLTLSSVENPNNALQKLKDEFHGKVHHLTPGQSVKDLKLIGKNLILYELSQSQKGVSEAELSKNDAQISKVTAELKELGIPYTAMYTAKEPSVVSNNWHGNMGRRLLATADSNKTFIHVNVTGCMLYAHEISISVTKNTSNAIMKEEPKTDGSKCGNSTGTLKLTWANQGGLSEVVMEMEFTYSKIHRMWQIGNMTLTAKGSINGTDVNEKDTHLDATHITAPKGYSYHCFPVTRLMMKGGNKSTDAIAVIFKGLQIQPDVRNGRFGHANDCIGFFTIPIFSGLIVALVLLAILTYGVAMIANISTQDRFDDPKGKPLNVHVPEHDK